MATAPNIDLSAVLAASRAMMVRDGIPRVMPSRFYEGMDRNTRFALTRAHGLYGLPTTELVEFLGNYINGRSALEIGAGNGAMAEALGIRATDNYQQTDPDTRLYAETVGGTRPVEYGENVERIDAHGAVFCYRPRVVVACWVTHRRMDPNDTTPDAGNWLGVIEEEIVANCDAYVFIGNRQVHERKPIWRLPHSVFEPWWVHSRAMNGSRDFIAVWENPRRKG